MATEYSNIAKADFRPSNLADGRLELGSYQVIEAIFTTTASTVTGGIIKFVYLPKGTRLYPTKGSIISSAAIAATTCTADVGTDTDDNILATAIDINAAGNVALDLVPVYELTVDEYVTATLTLTGAVTAGVTVTLLLGVRLP